MQAPSIALASAPVTTPPAAAIGTPALIVFGRDERGKPHASAFVAGDAALAERAADLMSMAVLRVGPEHQALAAQISRGRVFASGRAFVPFVKAALFASLEAAAGREPVGGVAVPSDASTPQADGDGTGGSLASGPGEPEGGASRVGAAGEVGNTPDAARGDAGDPPGEPSNLGLGSVVLATTGVTAEGWFESVVVRVVDAGLFELRWRDYDEPNIIRRRDHLALLPPALATGV